MLSQCTQCIKGRSIICTTRILRYKEDFYRSTGRVFKVPLVPTSDSSSL